MSNETIRSALRVDVLSMSIRHRSRPLNVWVFFLLFGPESTRPRSILKTSEETRHG